MIKKVKRQPQTTIAATQPALQRSPATITEPNCPKCGSTMTVRVAKHGANYGKTFWGCTGFPRCRGVVSID
jgi:restriction system protein